MYCRCCCRCTVQRDVRLLDVATAAAHLPCHSVRAAGRQSSQDVQNHQQEVAADSAHLLTSTSTYLLPHANSDFTVRHATRLVNTAIKAAIQNDLTLGILIPLTTLLPYGYSM